MNPIEKQESQADCERIAKRVLTVEAGEYLYEYAQSTCKHTLMPVTMDADVMGVLRTQLRARGLDWMTDDIGWLVVARYAGSHQ